MKKMQLKRSLKDHPAVQLISGMQWGDEGKGKIVDILCRDSDIVARFQGGANAGHTVKIGEKQFILHLLPTGILHENVKCIIGNGVVVCPESLLSEIDSLKEKGINALERLYISHNSHLILPYHKQIEKIYEEKCEKSIGTTGRGIGPAYADKAYRTGLRMGDLLDDRRCKEILFNNINYYNRLFTEIYDLPEVDKKSVFDTLKYFTGRVKDNITDTTFLLNKALHSGKKVLLEGAQGMLLDIDFGTYPYVTSSNTTVGGVFTGLGINPRVIDRNIGVLKAYTTRVGSGPFPTELSGEFGEKIRGIGKEYGATTGRPRRCGWLDGVLARYSVEINGIDAIALTKLDILDSLKEIKICTGYKIGNKDQNDFLTDLNVLENVEPVYKVLPGWEQSTSNINNFKDLPEEVCNYIDTIEEVIGIPVGLVSVGAERNKTIFRE